MIDILAFGDSLTWGADPATGDRHPYDSRWPAVLEAGLAGQARVIAEGLGGRTTCFDDHAAPNDRNATRALPMLLGSHQPLGLVIIMLGTNDLKPYLCGLASGAQAGMRRLIQITRTFPYKTPIPPRILIVAPPPCVPVNGGPPAQDRPIAESHRFAPLYRDLATAESVAFFDAGTVCVASEIDGVHMTAAATADLGRALVPVVRNLLR